MTAIGACMEHLGDNRGWVRPGTSVEALRDFLDSIITDAKEGQFDSEN